LRENNLARATWLRYGIGQGCGLDCRRCGACRWGNQQRIKEKKTIAQKRLKDGSTGSALREEMVRGGKDGLTVVDLTFVGCRSRFLCIDRMLTVYFCAIPLPGPPHNDLAYFIKRSIGSVAVVVILSWRRCV
jgi:hypothetical protein